MTSKTQKDKTTQAIANNSGLDPADAEAARLAPGIAPVPLDAEPPVITQARKKPAPKKKPVKPLPEVQHEGSVAKVGKALVDSPSSDNAQAAIDEDAARASLNDKSLSSEKSDTELSPSESSLPSSKPGIPILDSLDNNSLNADSTSPPPVLLDPATDIASTTIAPEYSSAADNSPVIERNAIENAAAAAAAAAVAAAATGTAAALASNTAAATDTAAAIASNTAAATGTVAAAATDTVAAIAAAITPDTAAAITPDTAAAITPDTAAAITPDTAAAITPDTAAAITPDTAAAIAPDTAAAIAPDTAAAAIAPDTATAAAAAAAIATDTATAAAIATATETATAAATGSPNSPTVAAPEQTSAGPFGVGWGIWAGAGAAALVGALALGSSKSSDSTPSTPSNPVTSLGPAVTIQNIGLGPLITTDPGKPIKLTASVYAADGKTLMGTGTVNAQGQASFTLDYAYNNYSGAAIVKITGTASYLDEATNLPKNFDSATSGPMLAALVLSGGQAVTVNVNPLTTFAAIEAGVQPDGSVDTGKAPFNAETVKAASTQVARLVGLTGDNAGDKLTQITPEYVVGNKGLNGADLVSSSDAAKVGTFLALVSGLEKSRSTDATPVTTKDVLKQLNDSFDITQPDDGNALAPLLLEGAGQVSNLGNSVNTYVLDKFKPTVVIQSDKSLLKVGDTANITFTFSTDPGSTFDAADIVLDGGTLGALSGSGLTRTATFTPIASVDKGTASITVKANSYTGAGGSVNNGQAGSSPSISYDTKAPTLAITSDKSVLKIGETTTITLTFSDDPTGFDISSDITVTGGTIGTWSGNGTTRTATFTPAANTNAASARFTVAAGNFTDAAGNASTEASALTISIDTQAPNAPTLAVGSGVTGGVSRAEATAASGVVSVNAESGSTVLVTFTDSATPTAHRVIKTVTGTGAATSVMLANTDLGSGPNMLLDGSISVSATTTDAAGNTSRASSALTISLDTLAPNAPTLALGSGVTGGVSRAEATVASGVVSVNAVSGSTVLVTFTDTATPAARSVIKTVTGTGAAIGVQLASTDITGAARLLDGNITVSATAADAAGNASTASSALTISLDTLAPNAPTLALGTGVSGGATAAEATAASGVVSVNADLGSTVLVTFTDSATPAARSVIKTVTGTGAAIGVQLTSTDITGAARLIDGNITVSATATDAAGNASTAGTSFTLDTVAPTKAVDSKTALNLVSSYQQYVKLPGLPATFGGDLTLEAWVYAKGSQGSWARIFDLASGTGSQNNSIILGFQDNTGKLAFTAFNGTSTTPLVTVAAPTALTLNTWHHVALTLGGAGALTATLYVDGVSVATGTLTAIIATAARSSSYVGHSNFGDPDFNGNIRDVRVYDNTLSAADITSDMNGNAPAATNVLTSYFPLITDANSGTPGGTAATLVGNPKFPIASLSFSADTEAPGDFVTRTAAQTISAKLGAALIAGETLQYRLDSGNSWTDVNAAAISGTSVTLSNITLLVGSHNLEFQVKDAAGNLGLLTSQRYTLDTKAFVPADVGMKLVKASSQFATLPAAAANVSDDLTMEAWVYSNGAQTAGALVRIFDLGVGENDSNLILANADGKFAYALRNGGTVVGSGGSTTVFTNNTWHHVALVVGTGGNNRTVTMYVNGESVTSGTLSADITSATRSSALVGKSNWSNAASTGEMFNGSIRDVRIYDDDRTQAEIRSDMAGIVDISDSNLKGYYPLSLNGLSGLDGGTAATLTASPVFTNPALSFSNDTGVLGDFKTSTTAQTITALLTGSLGAGEKVFGTVNGDAGTPTWVDLSSFTSSGTVTWTGVTLGATGEHLNGLQLQVRDSVGTNIGTLFTQSYTVL